MILILFLDSKQSKEFIGFSNFFFVLKHFFLVQIINRLPYKKCIISVLEYHLLCIINT